MARCAILLRKLRVRLFPVLRSVQVSLVASLLLVIHWVALQSSEGKDFCSRPVPYSLLGVDVTFELLSYGLWIRVVNYHDATDELSILKRAFEERAREN